MTHIHELSLFNVRNIKKIKLLPSSGINIIAGENGAGKTSILEAIHILSTTRSFRTAKSKHLIRHQQERLMVTASLEKDEDLIPLGIERSTDKIKARYNRDNVKSIQTITRALPVLVMHPTSYTLLTGEPGLRRSFLDWGAFHLRTDFSQHWKQYNRILAQRNAVLKQHGNTFDINVWNTGLVENANNIDKARRDYLTKLIPLVKNISNQLDTDITIEYRSGWNKDISLENILKEQLQRDRQAGFTWSGPHRADLIVKIQNHPVSTIASRGQLKLTTLILILAQALHYRKEKNIPCVLLLDDLPSEFDEKHLSKIMQLVKSSESQTFITLINTEKHPEITKYANRTFHVEQGKLNVSRET